LPKTSRTWKGARSPSGLKRVRQTKRRSTVLQPRRSAAKSLVAKALRAATQPIADADPKAVLLQALSALDRAAKSGAIHANAAARRKSRLTKRLNAATGGGQATSHAVKSTSRAQAAKAARARIAAARADKSKGTQTAAEKARAALTRTTRAETPTAAPTRARSAPKTTTKTSTTKASAAKTSTTKAAAKATSTRKPASGAKSSTRTTARKTSKS
jgi:ribosomal protein S20